MVCLEGIHEQHRLPLWRKAQQRLRQEPQPLLHDLLRDPRGLSPPHVNVAGELSSDVFHLAFGQHGPVAQQYLREFHLHLRIVAYCCNVSECLPLCRFADPPQNLHRPICLRAAGPHYEASGGFVVEADCCFVHVQTQDLFVSRNLSCQEVPPSPGRLHLKLQKKFPGEKKGGRKTAALQDRTL